jgi:predicted enzyme related to lactoylglutathione lyase
VLETENIQEMYETWRSRGVTFTDPPKAQPWGTQAIFVDSEENVLVLVQA